MLRFISKLVPENGIQSDKAKATKKSFLKSTLSQCRCSAGFTSGHFNFALQKLSNYLHLEGKNFFTKLTLRGNSPNKSCNHLISCAKFTFTINLSNQFWLFSTNTSGNVCVDSHSSHPN